MEEINFPSAVRKLLFALIGELPLEARENLAYASRHLYASLRTAVVGLRENARGRIGKARDSLPPRVADEYIAGLTMLVGDGKGPDPVQGLLDQLDSLADAQVDYSQKIQASKWEIIAEVIMLIAELALLTALMAFTGGASMSQWLLARARGKVAILLIVDRLLRMSHLSPTLSGALEEAVQTLAVRLAQIGLNSGARRPDGVDWDDVVKAGAFGALTSFFMQILEKFLAPIKNIFKNLLDDVFSKLNIKRDTPLFNVAVNGPPAAVTIFVVSGASESAAEVIINGAFEGNWEFKWETFVGSGLSGVAELGAAAGLGAGGLVIYNKYFNKDLLDKINPPPKPGSVLGSDPGGGSEKGPGPSKSPVSSGPSTVVSNGNFKPGGPSAFTPGPVTPRPDTTSSTDYTNGLGSSLGGPDLTTPLPLTPPPLPARSYDGELDTSNGVNSTGNDSTDQLPDGTYGTGNTDGTGNPLSSSTYTPPTSSSTDTSSLTGSTPLASGLPQGGSLTGPSSVPPSSRTADSLYTPDTDFLSDADSDADSDVDSLFDPDPTPGLANNPSAPLTDVSGGQTAPKGSTAGAYNSDSAYDSDSADDSESGYETDDTDYADDVEARTGVEGKANAQNGMPDLQNVPSGQDLPGAGTAGRTPGGVPGTQDGTDQYAPGSQSESDSESDSESEALAPPAPVVTSAGPAPAVDPGTGRTPGAQGTTPQAPGTQGAQNAPQGPGTQGTQGNQGAQDQQGRPAQGQQSGQGQQPGRPGQSDAPARPDQPDAAGATGRARTRR